MSLPAEPTLNFDSLITKITAAESWQYEPAELATCSDVELICRSSEELGVEPSRKMLLW